jgi:tRNA (guanine-N(7)-)-methyltransferase subunit TRM82
MPKRPCSLAITADQSTIICADKFGDVYSLPLLMSGHSTKESRANEASISTSSSPKPSKPFVPAANDLTIHTVRNRKALQNQMRMDQQISKKPRPDFELKLLLGHVSMLTDVVVVEREGRSYIITSDRDEHIRISRGLPQTHVIEGYCLGHKEFVSRLCLPATRPNILISGGGDDEILIWDWEYSKLLHKVNLRIDVEKVMTEFMQTFDKSGTAESSDEMHEPAKVAVSNIRHMERSSGGSGDIVIITCEG